MRIDQIALILKDDLKPPYYLKEGDIVDFTFFNKKGIRVRESISHKDRSIVSKKSVEFYKQPYKCNRDFFRLSK